MTATKKIKKMIKNHKKIKEKNPPHLPNLIPSPNLTHALGQKIEIDIRKLLKKVKFLILKYF